MPEALAAHTTLRLGGPAELVEVTTERQLIGAVAAADSDATPVLLVGGGSNLVVADEGFAGTAVLVSTSGMEVVPDENGRVVVTVAAGVEWEALVDLAVDRGWVGVEALSGVPGSVGATPIQNVGAYGQEVADTVVCVRCWDRRAAVVRTIAAADCGFGYRTSRFKVDPHRFVVLSVTFSFRLGERGAPVTYAELARTLEVATGERVALARVREAVLALRRAKGMVLDPQDHDTWSAGSFFTNPLLSPAQAGALPAGAPRWPVSDGRVKTSAAWLIEHSGFSRGYGNDRVRLSSKHTLALTNRGGATTEDLLLLASEVLSGVHGRFGVWLVNEPVLVGCALPESSAAGRGSQSAV